MPDWLKYAIVGLLAASGTNVGQFIGITQPAKAEVERVERDYSETMAASETIRDMLVSCNAQLQKCWQECR